MSEKGKEKANVHSGEMAPDMVNDIINGDDVHNILTS